MKQNICPTCSGLKIKKLILTTNDNELESKITINSEEFDIVFYMSKRKWNDSPWYLQYNIELNGKFDRDAIGNYRFLSEDWKRELIKQRESVEYKESCKKLKSLLSYENGLPIYEFSKEIIFEDNKGRIFKINEVEFSVPRKEGEFTSLNFLREEGYSLESDIVEIE